MRVKSQEAVEAAPEFQSMVWHHVEADISSVVLLVVSLPLFISLSLSLLGSWFCRAIIPWPFDVSRLLFEVLCAMLLALFQAKTRSFVLLVQLQGTKQLLLHIQLLSLSIFDACALPGAQYEYYSTCICVILWCELTKNFLSSSTSFLTLQSIYESFTFLNKLPKKELFHANLIFWDAPVLMVPYYFSSYK